MSTWEERMAAKAAARREASGVDEWGRPLPPPPVFQPREQAEADADAYCRDCTEVYLDGPHGWRTRLSCGFKCGHAHHEAEVWLAGSREPLVC